MTLFCHTIIVMSVVCSKMISILSKWIIVVSALLSLQSSPRSLTHQQLFALQSSPALTGGSKERTDSSQIDEQTEEEDQTEQTKPAECRHSTALEEKEPKTKDNSFDKMSVFKKKEKASLFQRTIDRLSYKSRKKKDIPVTAPSSKSLLRQVCQLL